MAFYFYKIQSIVPITNKGRFPKPMLQEKIGVWAQLPRGGIQRPGMEAALQKKKGRGNNFRCFQIPDFGEEASA